MSDGGPDAERPGSRPGDEGDGPVEDILAELVEEGEVADTAVSEGAGWLTSAYTFTHATSHDQCLARASTEFDRYERALDVPENVGAMAESIFEQYADSDVSDFLVELYAGAAFYCACKMNGVGVTPDEVAETGPDLLTHKTLLRRSKRVASELGLDPTMFVDSTQYVDRYCAELGLDDRIRERATALLEYCEEAGIASGKSPSGWAAAAVYLVATERGESVTQEDVAAVADVTTVTIRNRYQEQQELLNQVEAAPTRPEAVIEWAAARLDVDESVTGRAYGVVARLREFDVGDRTDPVLWGVAALRVASEAVDDPVGYRSLKRLTGTEGSTIRARVRTAKNGLREAGVDPFAIDPQAPGE